MSRPRALVVLVSLFGVASLLPRPAAAAAVPKAVTMGTGLTVNVPLNTALKKALMLNPRVAYIMQAHGKRIILLGVSAGVTRLHITTRRGATLKVRVQVTKAVNSRLYQKVRAFIGPMQGIALQWLAGFVFIRGRARTLANFGRLMHARRSLGGRVLNLAGYSARLVPKINRLLKKAGITRVRAIASNGTLMLGGPSGSSAELTKAGAVIRAAVRAAYTPPRP